MPPKQKKIPAPNTSKPIQSGYLVIVESPSKCKKIEEYLSSSYRCISSKGHFREIGGLKNIDTKTDFKCSYKIIDSKAEHVSFMRSIISTYSPDSILLAADDDREGEAIAWHICDEFGLDPISTKRVVFHEITKPAIVAAVASPRNIDMALVAAQHARQVLDMVVGFRVSPVLWRSVSNSKKCSLSAGRCQTPALRLVCERERAIRESLAAVSVKYRVVGSFFDQMIPFILQGDPIVGSADMLEFIHKSRDHAHYITVGDERISSRSPPKPLTTSKLLQAASVHLSIPPKKTMELAQILYQSGLITYMRTESAKFSTVFLDSAREFIQNKYPIVSQNPEKWFADFDVISNTDSANPHEAIRPTYLSMITFENENQALVKLYHLIWRTTVESCLAPAKFNVADIRASSPFPNNIYSYNWETVAFLGWKIVEQEAKSRSKKYVDDRDNASIPDLLYFQSIAAANQPVQLYSIDAKCVEKDAPPSHYTESSLIQKLEDMKIGRPSTFSSLVETIQDRGYVLKSDVLGREIACVDYIFKLDNKNKNNSGGSIEKIPTIKRFGEEKNKLVLQPIGEIVIDLLINGFESLFNYEYTENMERELDVVAAQVDANEAAAISSTMCRNCYDQISALLKTSSVGCTGAPNDETDYDNPVSEKIAYPLKNDPEKHIVVHPYGISIRISSSLASGETSTSYVNVRPDLVFDVETARRGEYTYQELVESGLGEYAGHPIEIKKGKFGEYVKWGDNTLSLKTVKPPFTRTKIVEWIESKSETKESGNGSGQGPNTHGEPKNKMILLEIDAATSVRNGKYGPYIYHQPPGKTKPDFHSLRGFKGNAESLPDVLKWIDDKIPSIILLTKHKK